MNVGETDYKTDVSFLQEEVEDYIKLVNHLFKVTDDSRKNNA